MNVVALRPRAADPRPAIDTRLARVAVFDDLNEAEAPWRALEEGLSTPYQHFDFLKAWQLNIGALAGVTPCIVVGFDTTGAPLFLWPFGQRRLGPWRLLEFLGGKHANFNMGLWRCRVAGQIARADLDTAFAALAGRADLVRLCNQPLSWNGTTNPFALLPRRPAANFGFSGTLTNDFEALLRAHTNSATRKKMRKKARALAEIGTVRFERPRDPQRIRQLLDAFFKQKHARMCAFGISDVFAEPGVRRFIETAASEQGPGAKPVIELYALTVDDIVVATMGGLVGGSRFCAMFNSIALGRYAVHSPGEQLILNLVRDCLARGLTTFDLGIGEAHYKGLFCPDAEPLFNSFLPLSAKGRLLGVLLALGAAAKRMVKQHAWLWSLVGSWRRLRARFLPAH